MGFATEKEFALFVRCLLAPLSGTVPALLAQIGPASNKIKHYGAGGGTRTHTMSPPTDFESVTSTNSITPAYTKRYYTRQAKAWQEFSRRAGSKNQNSRTISEQSMI